jgi:hypothetical protein
MLAELARRLPESAIALPPFSARISSLNDLLAVRRAMGVVSEGEQSALDFARVLTRYR